MDFLAALLVYAQSHDISDSDAFFLHQNYCENLYWQPDAQEKLKEASCDIDYTSFRIQFVKQGKNPDESLN